MFPYSNHPPQTTWPQPMMYYQSNLHPYDDQNFLNTVFNFNLQSIEAFQTLPHEEKLKFYLSVQEMKLLGYMNDRGGYEKILKEIARRVMIIKKPDLTKVNKQERGNQWGAKLEHLVDDHLKKIQKDNFLDDLPINFVDINNTSQPTVDFLSGQSTANQNQQQQFEWAQPNQQTNTIKQQPIEVLSIINNKQPKQNYSKSSQISTGQQNNNNNQQFFPYSQTLLKTQSMPYNQFQKVQSPQYNNYLSLQNVPPKQEHIDVWDLQVIQQQPDKLKKIIHENIKPSSKQDLNDSINNRAKSNKEITEANLFQQVLNTNDTHPNGSTKLIQNHSQISSQRDSQQLSNKETPQETAHFDIVEVRNSVKNENIQYMADEQTTSRKQQSKADDDEQFQWQQSSNVQQIETQNPPIDTHINGQNYISQIQPQNNLNDFNFFAPPQHTPNHQYSDRIYETQPQFQTLNQGIPSNNITGNQLETSFGFDLKSFENSYSLGNLSHTHQISGEEHKYQLDQKNNFKKKQPEEKQANDDFLGETMKSSIILNTIDFHVLQPLKRFPPVDSILFVLKKKVFDFDRQFYHEALNLIAGLGYYESPDYFYVKDQSHICDEIFSLTERYTEAVDQEKEQEIMKNLKRCKELYNQLDTAKTAKTIKKYLKMEGQSLAYQVGRLSLEAGVPKQLLQRSINDPNFTQIATILYLMVYLGNTYSISTYASQIIQYIQQVYAELQKIAEEVGAMPDECKKIIRSDRNFLEYKQNLRQIARLAKRIIELGTLCSKSELCDNMGEFIEKLNSISSKNSRQEEEKIIPNYFLTFFSEFACSNCNNIYTLHSQMTEFIEEHPICALCLENLQSEDHDGNNGGAKRDDSKFYHFKCWNLKSEVNKFKTNQMTVSKIL